jgi:hypothetical protein
VASTPPGLNLKKGYMTWFKRKKEEASTNHCGIHATWPQFKKGYMTWFKRKKEEASTKHCGIHKDRETK